ncbi:lytic transglycosylase domain-containing protein [Nonomuraea turkmeniaca]|uniref:Lytic transglycosylase domain-containing protein n=1 Tax=Nonomuraea turkmeniaca TaxID=103838 RepID=A0A5S4EVR1_9ACTN|nr:transglycosylase SLT domain-containing protein [Nonomuraea turkmeniaca]TMR07690.1 lytic transglycosylase domain-containing protein [Nonomuraea turkmeniaca]
MEERQHCPRRPARAAAAVTIAALSGIAACGVPAASGGAAGSAPARTATPAATPQTSSGEKLPAPGAAVPKDATRMAAALRKTTTALHAAIDRWSKKGEPPQDVQLLALYQQRIYRHAARNSEVASQAFARLPAALAAQAKDNTAAIRGLLALAHPVKPSATFKVAPARPAAELLGYFKKAERRFGVEWEVLAAVMLAETKFGRVRSASHTGAQGPMQFMPGTWRAYGMGGDVHDPRDAVMAAANYLRASGAPGNYRRALYAYNHSDAYVNAILLHARQIKRDPRNYYVYYNWQVFVLTTAGERRLTGPR